MLRSKSYLIISKIPAIIIFYLATILSCAKIKHPEGGPKDEIAPILISCNPAHGQVCFEGQEVVLVFNKEVKINDLNKIKISPSVQDETNRGFSCKARENIVTLKFDKKLKENITYTINFSDAIVSLSEEVSAENLIVTFSTGLEIDEMQISGIVVDLLTGIPISGAYVLLYAQKEAALPQNDIDINFSLEPNYFLKTDKDGKFTITNVKKGKYRIYATLNNNGVPKLYPSTYKYGAILDVIDVELESASDLRIPIVHADTAELKILKAIKMGNHAEIILSKPIEEYSFDSYILSNLSPNGKSIYIYNIGDAIDLKNNVLFLHIYARDNTHNVINQQIEIPLNKEEIGTIKSSFRINPTENSSIPEYGKFTISSTKPMVDLDRLNADGITIYLNDKPIFLSIENFEMNNARDKLYIYYDLSSLINHENNADEFLILRISEGTLIDIDENRNKEIVCGFKIKNLQKHGSISGTIYANNTDNYRIQLVTMDEKIIDEIESINIQNNIYKFNFIKPGKYFVRLLFYKYPDTFWSPGNYLMGIIPDPVYIYPAPVEILENWEIKDINFDI